MSIKIKIGGLSRLEDVDFINETKPDYAGVMLSKRSFLHSIDLETAKEIRKRLDPSIPLVGVFVNDLFTDPLVALRQGIVDIVQLQGTESEEYIRDLQFMSRKPVWKCIQANSPDVIATTVKSCADEILFGTEPDSGLRFDWELVKDVKRPYFISGTLTPEDIPAAIEQLNPMGVNLSAGVEVNGVKDLEKIRRAVAAAHAE